MPTNLPLSLTYLHILLRQLPSIVIDPSLSMAGYVQLGDPSNDILVGTSNDAEFGQQVAMDKTGTTIAVRSLQGVHVYHYQLAATNSNTTTNAVVV